MAKHLAKEPKKFKLGDLVRLKSGGPQMVIELMDSTTARCTWFYDGTKKFEIFQLATLDIDFSKPEP